MMKLNQRLLAAGLFVLSPAFIYMFNVGDKVVFNDVLLVDNGSDTTIGMPFIAGAKVTAEIIKIARAPKVTVIKYKAKSNYFKKRGHRQPFFEVKITKLA